MGQAVQIAGATFGWLVIAAAAIGIVYQLVGAHALLRFFRPPPPPPRTYPARDDAVTLLKPLYGPEPRLRENLATFLNLDHAGPVQMVCGVQRAGDPAIAVVHQLRAAYPDADIALVVDPACHGASGKVSNLINMMAAAKHDVLVMSDSDIAVGPDYLARILAALDQPGVGAVSCLYRGRGDAGFWSRFGAAGVTYQFIIAVVIAITYRLARPCMGSTIALRRDMLMAIGGFQRFADTLADDYAIGQAVNATGASVVIPPMIITHAYDETSLFSLWRHELRWSATVRDIAFWPYAGAIVCNPLPLAILACLYRPIVGFCLVIATLCARWLVVRAVDSTTGGPIGPTWMAWLHDHFAFPIFFATFFTHTVDWRGIPLKMNGDGRVSGREKSA